MRRNGDRGLVGGDREILDRSYGFHRTGDRWLPDRWLGMPSQGPVGPPPFDPTQVAGLVGWWEADAITGLTDGQPANTWPDKSSAKNNGTSTVGPLYYSNQLERVKEALLRRAEGHATPEDQDIINTLPDNVITLEDVPEQMLVNKPAVLYGGGNWMNLTDTIPAGPCTSFSVMRNNIYYQMAGITPRDYGGLGPMLYSPSGPTSLRQRTDGYNLYYTGDIFQPAVWCIATAVYPDKLFGNGQPLAVSVAGANGDGSPYGGLGSSYGYSYGTTQGWLAAVLHYNRILTDLERMQVSEWLGTKYALPVPPAGNYAGIAVLDKEYDLYNTNDNMFGTYSRQGMAMSFVSTGGRLATAVYKYPYLFSGATGNAYSKLYTRNGAIPGTLLATATPIDTTPLPKNAAHVFNFNFPNPYFLIAGRDYFISFEFPGTDGILFPLDTTNGYAGGVGATLTPTGWQASNHSPFSIKVVKPNDPSPLDIPGLKGWWKPESISPVSGLVATWPESSGMKNHLTQPTPANQGTYGVGLNGYPFVSFDGGPRALGLTTPIPAAAGQPWTIISLMFTGSQLYALTGTAGFNGTALRIHAAIGILIQANNNRYDSANLGDWGNWHIYSGDSSIKCWRDGVAITPLTPAGAGSSQNCDFTGIGSDYGTAQQWGVGGIHETLYFDHVLSDTDRKAAESYLATKFGLTIAGILREAAEDKVKKELLKRGLLVGVMPGPEPPTE
jgi:hypothetical protein